MLQKIISIFIIKIIVILFLSFEHLSQLENESMMEERKLLNEKMERSFDEADELKSLNSM